MNVNILRSELESIVRSLDNNFNDNNEEFDPQNSDQIWVNHWINSRLNANKDVINEEIVIKSKPNKPSITINEFQFQLKCVFNLLSDFNQKLNVLNESIDSLDENEWISSLSELSEQKEVLNEKIVSMKTLVPTIKCKIRENKQKRSKKLDKNENHKKLVKESIENRNKLIDEWIESNKESKEKTENERLARKEANIVSIDVKTKIKDTIKCLKRVNTIERLRDVLKTKAQQRSERISEESNAVFRQQINELKALLKERLEMYRKEENAINSMINIECHKQYNDKREQFFVDLNKSQLKIYESLFGNQSFPETNNLESLKNWQFFERSHHNIQNMIAIRNSWDSYVDMNCGSSVPKNYVVPNDTPNHEWHKYLHNSY